MSELTEFLLARIAEEEAWIERGRALSGGAVLWEEETIVQATRECEAKRRIVKVARFAPAGADGWGFRRILKDLASVYADHEDYRDEWKP